MFAWVPLLRLWNAGHRRPREDMSGSVDIIAGMETATSGFRGAGIVRLIAMQCGFGIIGFTAAADGCWLKVTGGKSN
jgi:hypothetical protein